MHIMIADNDAGAIRLFKDSIRSMGHIPITCATLNDVIEYIKITNNPLEILYLDNHFGDGEFGISYVKQMRTFRPNLNIVITTSLSVEPNLVEEILVEKVGFLVKPTIAGNRISADIAQRIAYIEKLEIKKRETLQDLVNIADKGKEGLSRFFSFWRKSNNIEITDIVRTDNKVIIPQFYRYGVVHQGLTSTIQKEVNIEVHVVEKIMVSTELGFGLNFAESSAFFTSPIGLELKNKIISKLHVESSKKINQSYKVGQIITIPPEDAENGIRKREYYCGVEHIVCTALIKRFCKCCSDNQAVNIEFFIPDSIVEVSIAYDKEGFIVENGSSSYQIRAY
jgi:response regulator of citrate/malate metabolism